MLKLLIKEFKLFVIKPTLLFFLMTISMIIPSYPAIIAAMFSIFIIQICYQMAIANHDIEFTAMLPVSRKKIVASKIIVTMLIQLTYLALCIPFALISSLILNTNGNDVGMDKCIAFFGYALVAIAVFNSIFFPLFFKDTHKLGLPFFCAIVGYLVFCSIFEIVVSVVPAINAVLDTLNPAMLIPQLIFLACGIVIYSLVMLGSYKLSVKAFEKMVI